ncbi:HEAT repeat domain-containing protein [uncultured Friedmanniella sp.]|uniref:HEAT repeat domain-containing protein n=1 Tax=uncultured Friedmanniella sp. TaxID=335381 RepID=UPI0035C97B49
MTSSETALATVLRSILTGEDETELFYAALEQVEEHQWPALLALADHPSPAVRLALVSNLPFFTPGEPPAGVVLETAIRLTTDADARVRDHACFVLGTQCREVDTPELREVLALRLDDLDRDTRCEALLGLAFRGDQRALPRVRAALTRPTGDVWRMEMLAAGALGDPDLHPLVLRHLDGWDDEDKPSIEAGRRLTDPAGPGSDLFRGVAEFIRARAHHQPGGDLLTWWLLMIELLDLAPHREWDFHQAVRRRLTGDDQALEELDLDFALTPVDEEGGATDTT